MTKTFAEQVAEARARVGAVSATEAAAMSEAMILDVREDNEVAAKRISGAFVHIPLGQLAGRATSDPTLAAAKGARQINVLCAVGGRAAIAAAALEDMGFDAKVIEGGIGAWDALGLPVEVG